MAVRLALLFLSVLFYPLSAEVYASIRQEVYVSGTVQSFGGYTFTDSIRFNVADPGKKEIGTIVVNGIYNGEYPWIMRIYTDNLHFTGITGAIQRPSAGGLVSKDGRFTIPLEVRFSNFGTDVWRHLPDLNEPGQRPYHPSTEPGIVDYTDCILMGIDPRNATWVAGPDKVLFTDDDNALGDTTVPTPFEIGLRADIPATAVQGEYEAFLYIEIVPAP